MLLLTGGTGFLGTHLATELIQRGYRVRCGSRTQRPRFAVEGISPELSYLDITDRGSILRALDGVSEVVHLVGILTEGRALSFKAIHVRGTENLLEACKAKGVKRLIHISALGTSQDARSNYHKTKWQAEELVRASGLEYTILRPSVIFGRGDRFTTLLARAIRWTSLVVVPCSGKNRMQPVYVKDLVKAIAACVERKDCSNKTLEVAGKEVLTFDSIIDRIAQVCGRRAIKIHLPEGLVRAGAALMEYVLPKPPLTRDTLIMLKEDNTTENNALTEVFHIEPTPFRDGLREYLC